jgi:hypothetical protein
LEKQWGRVRDRKNIVPAYGKAFNRWLHAVGQGFRFGFPPFGRLLRLLRIASPSKEMGWVGKMMVEGLLGLSNQRQ